MKNEHAAAVIDAYLEAESLPVPHAVLVEGPWGSGKTYFLEQIYEPERQKRARAQRFTRPPFLFVSLFGVKSAVDVEKRMHRAASPSEVATGKAIGTIITGAMEYLKIKDATKTTLDGIEKRASRRHVDYILVFDDLERVEKGALGEVMGLVNSLVVTDKRRVLLVGDEAKLLEIHADANWAEQNEKIVGRRVRIESDVESVVRRAVGEIGNDAARAFMAERLDALIDLARRSDVENLRNLSWAIVNAARFVQTFLSDADIPPEHVARTMLVVVATTLWYRSKKLSEKSLLRLPNLSRTLIGRSMGSRTNQEGDDPETAAAKRFSETFADLTIESPPLEYGRIVAFEASGILDDTDLTTWTRSQFGFGAGRSEPAWRRLWHSYDRSMADTERAIGELAVELEDGAHTKRGVILHATGLAIRLRKAGDTRLTRGMDVVPYFRTYIDTLFDSATLEENVLTPLPLDYESAGGLGFLSKDTAEFAEVHRYLTDKQTQVHETALKNKADEIVGIAEAGDMEALHQLNMANDELARSPVLLDIDVERMANLLTSDVPAVNIGARLLAYRYHHGRPGDPLMTEIPWARKVYEAVLRKVEQWPEPHRSLACESLQGMIRHYEQGRIPDERIIPADEQVGDDVARSDV